MTLFALPDPGTEIGAAVEVALAACDEADAISLASFRRTIRIEAKPDATFVTEADTAVERAVRERITARFPDHGLVGEEYGVAEARSQPPGTVSTAQAPPPCQLNQRRCRAGALTAPTTRAPSISSPMRVA